MQMESLSWCLGQLGSVRPLGSTLRFPNGEEWHAFGFTTNRWYRHVPSDRHAAGFPTLEDVRRCRASAGAAGVSGSLVSTFSPLYTDLGGTHLDGDRLLQLCLLLHGEHTLPSWMKELEPGQLNLLEIRL